MVQKYPRASLPKRLVGSGRGTGAKTLRIVALSPVYSIAEYCIPFWCRSAHICVIDSAINKAFRIVSGCLRLTPNGPLIHIFSHPES